ncbi:MAG: alanine racemase [Clostridiales bacterium]|nr:alanine racemase [Clostridiales bacterium]
MNIRSIRAQTGALTEVIPVLKCDAYGLGAGVIAREIAKGTDVRTFAVAQVGEAAALRNEGIRQEILVLAGVPEEFIAPAIEKDIQLTVYSAAFACMVIREALRQGKQAGIQIKIETGLNRLGVRPGEELAELLALLKGQSCVKIKGVYSHFIDGEMMDSPLALAQFSRFEQALEQIRDEGLEVPLRHMCNSGASDWYREALLDGMRIGRRLYMDSQRQPRPAGTPGAVEEAASWRTRIVNLRLVQPGETVGYDEAFRATAPTTVAVIAVGYGDGLDERLAGTQAPVLVTGAGAEARYLCICMDQSMIDVSGIDCRVGDEVTLWGRTTGGAFLSAQRVGAAIGHEGVYFYSRLSHRVQRVYINANSNH